MHLVLGAAKKLKIDTDLIYEGIATSISSSIASMLPKIDTDLIYEGIATFVVNKLKVCH